MDSGKGNVYECRAKGIFRKEKLKPLVGDYAQIEVIDEKEKTGTVVKILQRKNQLIRPMIGSRMELYRAQAPRAMRIQPITRPPEEKSHSPPRITNRIRPNGAWISSTIKLTGTGAVIPCQLRIKKISANRLKIARTTERSVIGHYRKK